MSQASAVSRETTPVGVAALDRLDEAPDELALAGGARQRCLLAAAGRTAGVERRPRALQRALDRCLAALEHVRHLGTVKAEHVPKHEHGPLARREMLECRYEREPDRLAHLVARLRLR